jgi:hypothetical protein
MSSTHNGTLRHAVGLLVVFIVFGLLMIIVPLAGKAYGLAFLAAGVLAIVAWRFSRLQLEFTEQSLIYRGWFRRYEFPYSNIEHVSRPSDEGWPNDRFYGHTVFEVASSSSRARINLLWFGPAGSVSFRDRLVRRSAKKSA